MRRWCCSPRVTCSSPRLSSWPMGCRRSPRVRSVGCRIRACRCGLRSSAIGCRASACRSRSARPVNAEAGASGGASGSGAMPPSGATTVICGPDGAGGVPCTAASHAVMTVTAPSRAAVVRASRHGRCITGSSKGVRTIAHGNIAAAHCSGARGTRVSLGYPLCAAATTVVMDTQWPGHRSPRRRISGMGAASGTIGQLSVHGRRRRSAIYAVMSLRRRTRPRRPNTIGSACAPRGVCHEPPTTRKCHR